MRSRRFVALFGGRMADGPGELKGGTGDGNARGQEGTVVAIVEAADVGRRDVGGTARHASARATWRETIRANNRQEAPPSWRERGTTVVLNLVLRGNNKAESRKMVIADARGVFRPFVRTIQTGERNYSY